MRKPLPPSSPPSSDLPLPNSGGCRAVTPGWETIPWEESLGQVPYATNLRAWGVVRVCKSGRDGIGARKSCDPLLGQREGRAGLTGLRPGFPTHLNLQLTGGDR